MKKKWLAAAAGLCISMYAAMTAFGADGTWMPVNGDWQYRRADGTMAKNSWEDIDGEWYHFGSDGFMETGWHKISNIRYYFEPNGILAEGWKCYNEGGEEQWYYFDREGQAVIQWLYDDGKWYWFNANGVMNTEPSRTIGNKKYYFNEDGSAQVNLYRGFKYYDVDGQADSDYDVRAENRKGKKISIPDDEKDEIAEKLNALPKGWLKKFVDDGWTFVYCPDKEYYSSAKFEDGSERYYFYYKLSVSDKIIRFCDKEDIWTAFGEYIYRNVKSDLRELNYPTELSYKFSELSRLKNLPDSLYEDHQTLFGLLLSEYLDEAGKERMENEMEDLYFIMNQIVNSRDGDGKPLEMESPWENNKK